VVILYIWEILGAAAKQQTKPKRTKRAQASDFAKNTTRLKSSDRKLDAKKPVKPVVHVS
jgi:hypothetical protein